MSFLTDLFEGHTSNLGNDLSPSNIFSDTKKDIGGKNTLEDILGGAALLTGGIGLAGGLGAFGGAAAGTAAADTGFDLATIGPGVTDAGTAIGAADAALPAEATLDAFETGAGDATLTTPWSAGGIAPLDSPAPIGTTLGALTPAATDAGILSVPGIADSGVAASDITTDAAAGGASQPSFLNQLVTGASNSITKNPLGLLAAGTGLGLDILNRNKSDPNLNALEAQAPGFAAQGAGLTASGQTLQSYLTNGTLPPGQQAQVTEAVQAAKARIISNHAANGENTNPTQNSALAQELSQADLNGLALAGQLETQLASTGQSLITAGLTETGLSSEIYQALVKIDQTNNNQLMSAIASMAAALNGGTKIQIGGNSVTA